MAKRKTKRQKIKAASRVQDQTPAREQYTLPENIASKAEKTPSPKKVTPTGDTRVSLSYKWVKHDILYSLGVSGGIFVLFAVIYFAI